MTLITVLFVLPILAALPVHRLDRDQGLDAVYYNRPDWTSPAFTAVDPELTTPALRSRFAPFGSLSFSVAWHGQIAIDRAGTYRFATLSDDGSTVEIDGALIVDNGGPHGVHAAAGDVSLNRGLHRIRINYFQGVGGTALGLFWSVDGGPLVPIPASVLVRDGATWARYRTGTWFRRIVVIGPAIWIALLQLWLLRVLWPRALRALGTPPGRERRILALILAGSALLLVAAISWGLRGEWAPDEVSVGAVLDGARQFFAGGWYERYPPLHYWILAATYSPFLALSGTTYAAREAPTVLFAATRLITVEMAVGSLIWIYAIGRQIRGAYTGLTAAVAAATLPLFVYYGKTANVDVPYLFWSLGALFFYMRIVAPPALGMPRTAPRDHWWFAGLAMLAVATKDQAYGLFVLPSLHLLVARWRTLRRERPDASALASIGRVLADSEMVGAVLVGLAVLAVADNIIFNWTGFLLHVNFIIGPGSEGYRAFPRTLMGQWAMLRSVMTQLRWSLGWPLSVAAIAALAMTALVRKARPRLWLVLPAVSYYAAFIGVISYSYDRFLLPICVLLILVAAGSFEDALDRLRNRPQRTLLAGAAALVGIYGLAYGASVDRMMLSDSRYAVERWIADQVPLDATIGSVGYRQYLPGLNPLRSRDLVYDDFEADPPDFVVANAEHVARWAADSEVRRIYAVLTGGQRYRMVFDGKTEFVLAPLANRYEVQNRIEDGFTNLDKINPEIQVFQRVKPR